MHDNIENHAHLSCMTICTFYIIFLAKTRHSPFLAVRVPNSSQFQMWVFGYFCLEYISSILSYKDAIMYEHIPFTLHCSEPCTTLNVKIGFCILNHFTHLRLGMPESWVISTTFNRHWVKVIRWPHVKNPICKFIFLFRW